MSYVSERVFGFVICAIHPNGTWKLLDANMQPTDDWRKAHVHASLTKVEEILHRMGRKMRHPHTNKILTLKASPLLVRLHMGD